MSTPFSFIRSICLLMLVVVWFSASNVHSQGQRSPSCCRFASKRKVPLSDTVECYEQTDFCRIHAYIFVTKSDQQGVQKILCVDVNTPRLRQTLDRLKKRGVSCSPLFGMLDKKTNRTQ